LQCLQVQRYGLIELSLLGQHERQAAGRVDGVDVTAAEKIPAYRERIAQVAFGIARKREACVNSPQRRAHRRLDLALLREHSGIENARSAIEQFSQWNIGTKARRIVCFEHPLQEIISGPDLACIGL